MAVLKYKDPITGEIKVVSSGGGFSGASGGGGGGSVDESVLNSLNNKLNTVNTLAQQAKDKAEAAQTKANQIDNLKYAGSNSTGGPATSAEKLTTTNIGDENTPIYIDADGKPVAIQYKIETNVPANAEFTDTKYNLSTIEGTLSIEKGGTGANTSADALTNLGALAASLKGANDGLAELDSTGKVPIGQLPSYVDEVLEYANKASFPTLGEVSKIYIDIETNKTYRWSGTQYTEISASLALGETSSTAYRGDHGKAAYKHSQAAHAKVDATKTEASTTNGNIKIDGVETTVYTHPGSGTNPHGTTKSDVGLGNVENKSSATIRGELTKNDVTTALGFDVIPTSAIGAENGVAAINGNGEIIVSKGLSRDSDELYFIDKDENVVAMLDSEGVKAINFYSYNAANKAYEKLASEKYIAEKITEINGNIGESAAGVRTDLDAYIESNNQEITSIRQINNNQNILINKLNKAVQEIEFPVTSVNNKTGTVELNAEDVGARANTWMPTAEQVKARPDDWMPTAEEVGAISIESVGVENGVAAINENGEIIVSNGFSNNEDTLYFIDENENVVALIGEEGIKAINFYSYDTGTKEYDKLIGENFITTNYYNKADTLDKIQEKITEINGGESAGEVLANLNSYKETNNAKNDAQDTLIDGLQNSVDTLQNNVNNIKHPVLSVNGKTGAISLTADDVRALPIIDARSSSYNLDDIIKLKFHSAIYLTNSATEGTPYKKGNSLYQTALIINYTGYTDVEQGTQLALMNGSSTCFVRHFYNNNLSEWQKLYHSGNPPTPNEINAYSLKEATPIASNDNLNDYTLFGNYVATNSIAESLLNCPIENGFVLHVERSGNATNGYCKQRIVPYNDTIEFWRILNNNNWSPWIRSKTNENLLDNWYFLDPINNRGLTEYPNKDTIDRWYGGNYASVKIVENGIQISNNSTTELAYFSQYTENGYEDGQYTLSAVVTAITLPEDSSKIRLRMTDIRSYQIEEASTTAITSTGLCSLTYTVTSGNFHRAQITIPPGASITLSAIKLEKGNTQTLAYKNKTATDEEATWIISDTPPNKGIELLKCIQAKPMTSSGEYKDAWSHHEIYHTGNKPIIKNKQFFTTITSELWQQYDETSGWKANVSVDEILETDTPVIGVITEGFDFDTCKLIIEEWNKIIYANTYNGGIEFIINGIQFHPPQINIPIQIVCI